MSKQTTYNAGIYVRLSQEDMRAGESLSIENQKLILTKYVAEQGWNLIDTYVDDGYSGTDFNRPAVIRLLDDAKMGKINLIIVKDLSRFGRNYIQVGQYIDYIFPTYNIRFIALNDNVDTLNTNSTAMDMMPIMNVFNEWHAANTSKKIKAVIEANCKAGKYRAKYLRHNYQCGAYSRYGKFYCTSHHIKMKDINAIVLTDIRMIATLVVEDEEKARQQFLAQKEQINSHQTEMEQKRLRDGKYRLEELRKLIPSIYEDKVLGKIPEDVCVNLLEKYQAEQKELSEDVSKLEAKLSAVKQDKDDVEEFIRRLKKYTDVQELTREMALELIEYVTIDEYSADRPRDIHIYYKLLDKPLLNKLRLDTAKIEKPLD